MCNIFIWNWSNTMNVQSALWILMAWCLSTRASVATVLTTHPCISQCLRVKPLVLGRCGSNFKSVITEHILQIKFISTSCEIPPSSMPQNTFNDKLKLVQVMVWCHHATSQYLSPSWLRSLLPQGITRPQWVKVSYVFVLYSECGEYCNTKIPFCWRTNFDYKGNIILQLPYFHNVNSYACKNVICIKIDHRGP